MHLCGSQGVAGERGRAEGGGIRLGPGCLQDSEVMYAGAWVPRGLHDTGRALPCTSCQGKGEESLEKITPAGSFSALDLHPP